MLFVVSFHRNDADDTSSSIYETDEEESDSVNAFSLFNNGFFSGFSFQQMDWSNPSRYVLGPK